MRDRLLGMIEAFMGPTLGEVYEDWRGRHSFDGILPEFARRVGDRMIEIRGDVWLINQTLEPVHIILEVVASGDALRRLECRVGRRVHTDNGDPMRPGTEWPQWLDWKLGRIDQIAPADWRYGVAGQFD